MAFITDLPSLFRRALRLSLGSRLRPWVLIPLFFNIFLFGGLFWAASHFINLWLIGWLAGLHFSGFWGFLDGVVPVLGWLLMGLVWLLLLVMFANVFTLAVHLVAAPFMGLLAERVNRDTCATPLPPESLAAMIRRTLWRELRKLWYWLWRAVPVLLLVLVLYLIPGLNLLAAAVWFLFSAWILALQYIDYGADCRLVPLRTALDRLGRQRWLVLGFGCIMLALTLVPLLNLLVMPVGVVAGVLLWNEKLAPDLLNPADRESSR